MATSLPNPIMLEIMTGLLSMYDLLVSSEKYLSLPFLCHEFVRHPNANKKLEKLAEYDQHPGI